MLSGKERFMTTVCYPEEMHYSMSGFKSAHTHPHTPHPTHIHAQDHARFGNWRKDVYSTSTSTSKMFHEVLWFIRALTSVASDSNNLHKLK